MTAESPCSGAFAVEQWKKAWLFRFKRGWYIINHYKDPYETSLITNYADLAKSSRFTTDFVQLPAWFGSPTILMCSNTFGKAAQLTLDAKALFECWSGTQVAVWLGCLLDRCRLHAVEADLLYTNWNGITYARQELAATLKDIYSTHYSVVMQIQDGGKGAPTTTNTVGCSSRFWSGESVWEHF